MEAFFPKNVIKPSMTIPTPNTDPEPKDATPPRQPGLARPTVDDHIYGRALVAITHNEGFVLCWDGGDALVQYLDDCGCTGRDGTFPLENANTDWNAKLPDGIYVGELMLVDDGPGDWSGSRECALRFHNERLVTAEEWKAHRDGEWPWEPWGA